MNRIIAVTAAAVGAVFVLTAQSCDQPVQTSRQKEAAAQERLSEESIAQVGNPAIVNFAEKRNYKMIYELRDNPNYATYTYLVGMRNELRLLCHSIGYGIPESSQYTNPQMLAYASSQVGVLALPQADPNGLFSSASANGTWVMCLGPDGKIAPVRAEPNVLTSPFPLE
jgi:hypothetical protein